MTRRQEQVVVLFVIGVLLTPLVGPALAAVQTVFVGGGTPIGTQSDLTVRPGNDEQLDLENPWLNSRSIEFHNVTFRGRTADVTVDSFGDPNNGGQWTNLSSMSVQNGRVFVERSSGKQIGVEGSVDSFKVAQRDLTESVDNVDIIATAGASWTLHVNDTGLSQGTGVVAENAETGEALDSAAVAADGNVTLNELDTVTNAEINLRVGPSELFVFQEANPTQLVDNVELRIRVFGEDEVFQRTVNDGTADLTGVPSDQRLSITVSGEGSDYGYRRITIPSVTQQAEVYLLNTTNNNQIDEVQFQIDDRTGGDFSTDTTRFLIEKPITKDFDSDGSNETRYQVISGDTIGSSGSYSATLESDERYRLKVSNADGDTRVLGSYVVRGPAAPTVTIGQVILEGDDKQGYAADLQVITEDSNGDGTDEQFIRVVYKDKDRQTEQLQYTVENVTSGTTIVDKVVGGPLGTHTFTQQVAANNTAATYKLSFNATREQEDGTDVVKSGERFAGDVPAIAGQLPIDGRWLSLIGWVSILALSGLMVIYDPVLAAFGTVGWAGLLTVIGVLSIPAPALGLAGAVAFVALIGRRA